VREKMIGMAAVAALASAASAQPVMNEIYASHTGTDDAEFIELLGTPGASLDGFAILVVEGEQGSAIGTVDRVYDLTGNVIPGDGYFVLGTSGTANVDFNIGNDNALENGTETFALLQYTSLPSVGTDLDTNDDGIMETPFSTYGSLLEAVGIIEDVADITYGGAPRFGPDGSFFPAGIFRPGDAPNSFSASTFLDFGDPDGSEGDDNSPTPGGMNLPTPGSLALLGLGGLVAARRRRA